MSETPAFLDRERPPTPDIVVARGLVPFHLPDRPVRGRLVRLGALADALLTRHPNQPAVTVLVGQALALAAGLAGALKFRGSFSLQAKGDGALPLLLADCTDTGALRGYARAAPERLAAVLADGAAPSAAALLGKGYLAFTVDQGGERDRHQGIVAIAGDSLADMAMHYFRTSEQLGCWVRLACAPTPGGWRAGALILERIAPDGGTPRDGQPGDGDHEPADDSKHEDSWRTALALAGTLTDTE